MLQRGSAARTVSSSSAKLLVTAVHVRITRAVGSVSSGACLLLGGFSGSGCPDGNLVLLGGEVRRTL